MEEEFTYTITRSPRRKTIGIIVGRDGNVEVRVPYFVSHIQAQQFVESRRDWIIKSRNKMLERQEQRESRNWDDVKSQLMPWISGKGKELFQKKVDQWALKMGVSYNRITIRDTISRWGSCSAKKNLSFSWKVFVMPERLVDYLVVHELAHLRYMNHSKEFWNLVGTYIPDYKTIRKEFLKYE